MKKKLGFIMVLSMCVATSPAFAGHDHGAHESMNHEASQAPLDDQNAKEGERLINNCIEYVDRIQQHVQRLKAQIKEKRVGTSVCDEIKRLEESLKEANYNARSLQIM